MWRNRLFSFLLLLGLCFSFHTTSLAAGTDYNVMIIDDADLLSDEDEAALSDVMQESVEYGNVFFHTVVSNPYGSTKTLLNTTYRSYYGDADGVAFILDMDERFILISGFGNVQYVITNSYCETITDNVYNYASVGYYYTCAEQTFLQISELLHGKDVPQPMRHICNALLCLLFALLLEFFFAMTVSRKRKANLATMKKNIDYHCEIQNPHAKHVRTTRVYNPPSDNGSSSSDGGDGGGGGSSSSGGHSF